MKKTLLLSLSLSFLLHAEDDGFYMSAGYQIGEASQMVKNTKGIQRRKHEKNPFTLSLSLVFAPR